MANSQDLCSLVLSPGHGQDKHHAGGNKLTQSRKASQAGANPSPPNGVRYHMGIRAEKVETISAAEDRARAWTRQAARAKRPTV